MSCSEVLLKLETIVDLGDVPSPAIQTHLNSCDSCSLVLSEHRTLKQRLKNFVADIKPPAQLEQILQTVCSQESKLGKWLEDSDGSVASSVTQELLREDIIEVMKGLSAQERDVLRLRFGLDDGQTRTLEEVGLLFGCSREEIRIIEAKALRRLRHPKRSRRSRRYLPPTD